MACVGIARIQCQETARDAMIVSKYAPLKMFNIDMLNLNPKLADTIAKAAETRKLPLTPEKMEAFFRAAEIAMKAVTRAGAAGNVQCQIAVEEMEPFLTTMKQNE